MGTFTRRFCGAREAALQSATATVRAAAPGSSVRDGQRLQQAAVPGRGALVGLLGGHRAGVPLGRLAVDDDDQPVAAAQAPDSREPARNTDPVVTSTTDDPDWANLAATVGPSVVAIDVRTASGAGAGSGVIVDTDGSIITNHHVAGGAAGGNGEIVVALADGRLFPASVVGTDQATDLAVIRLDDPPDDLQPATLGNSEDVVVGDPVAAIGNPLGLSNTVTTGIVSALDRPTSTQQEGTGQTPVLATTNAIQVDAPINPGNSGGPLFDAEGRVIGINSSIASLPNAAGGQAGSIGLGFAIPSNLVRLITDQLMESGTARHAYLGVVPVNATVEVDGERRAGAGVQSVQPDTPAAEAGLQARDVVIAVDDNQVTGAESLIGFVRAYPSGQDVTVTVARDGRAQDFTVTLATREDQLG